MIGLAKSRYYHAMDQSNLIRLAYREISIYRDFRNDFFFHKKLLEKIKKIPSMGFEGKTTN